WRLHPSVRFVLPTRGGQVGVQSTTGEWVSAVFSPWPGSTSPPGRVMEDTWRWMSIARVGAGAAGAVTPRTPPENVSPAPAPPVAEPMGVIRSSNDSTPSRNVLVTDMRTSSLAVRGRVNAARPGAQTGRPDLPGRWEISLQARS